MVEALRLAKFQNIALQNQLDTLKAIRRVSDNDAPISTDVTDLEADIEEAPGDPSVGAKNVSVVATETGTTNPNRTDERGDCEFHLNQSAPSNGLTGTTGETHLRLELQPVPELWRKAPKADLERSWKN